MEINTEIHPREMIVQGKIVGQCEIMGETRIRTNNIPKIILAWQLNARQPVEIPTDLKTWVGNEMQVYQDSVAEFNVYAFRTKLIKYKNNKKSSETHRQLKF